MIHAAPQLGARFTQMTAEFAAGGSLGPAPAQRFIYVLEGELELQRRRQATRSCCGRLRVSAAGRAAHCTRAGSARAAVIEKTYEPLAGAKALPRSVVGDEAASRSGAADGR